MRGEEAGVMEGGGREVMEGEGRGEGVMEGGGRGEGVMEGRGRDWRRVMVVGSDGWWGWVRVMEGGGAMEGR